MEQEGSWPCRYIDPKSNQLYLFRVSYYGTRINLEVFHAVTDGMGAVNFLKELTAGYLELKREGAGPARGREKACPPRQRTATLRITGKCRPDATAPGRRCALLGDIFPLEGRVWSTGTRTQGRLKAVSRKMGVEYHKVPDRLPDLVHFQSI